MFKVSNARILLLAILVFSLGYRLFLMHSETYPPGADIGLHESVIKSITGSGSVDFFWNNYQMGGGPSVTFPGYHIFVSYIILLTGIPDFVAHSLVVSLFSTLIVAIAFLVTRRFWGQSTAFIVAFFVAVSRFDIEMLLWGGFPNVITLALIPLTLYLFLEHGRFSSFSFFSMTTLLIGSILVTHSLSAVVFLSLAISLFVFGSILSRKIGTDFRQLAVLAVPFLLGAAVVSPFLVQAVPAYLSANAGTTQGDVPAISDAILSTRVLPAEIVVPLFACVTLFFLFSKEYKGKFLTVPSLLLTLWILVPMVFTQGYLIKQYWDYNRLLYFILFPLLVLIGMAVDHGSRLLAEVFHTYIHTARGKPRIWKELQDLEVRLRPCLTRKNLYSGFLLTLLLSLFLGVTIFMAPWEGVRVQSFYQVMNDPGYDAIQWARTNTPQGANFTSDALYGWWLGGFAQRPTISAVDPQYLANSNELAPAEVARNLLDTDYVVDNGLIQVREDGGYVGRHNPMFLGKLNWTYFPYPFFNFNNDDTTVVVNDGNDVKFFTLDQLSVLEMRCENSSNQAEISVKKGNNLFSFTQVLTVYKLRKFVNISITIESIADEVSLLSFNSILHIRGIPITKTDMVGVFEEGSKVLGQVIYSKNHPEQVNIITPENPSGLEFVYNLNGDPATDLQLFVSAFSVSDSRDLYENTVIWENPYLNDKLNQNAESYLNPDKDLNEDSELVVFDYRKALVDRGISYIACRDSSVLKKFTADPTFSRVFINDEVSVFKVKSNFS